jgi:hypothetical protein
MFRIRTILCCWILNNNFVRAKFHHQMSYLSAGLLCQSPSVFLNFVSAYVPRRTHKGQRDETYRDLVCENNGMFSVEGPAPKWGVGMALGAKVLGIKFHFKMLPLMYRSQKYCMQIKSFDPNVVPQALLHTSSYRKSP